MPTAADILRSAQLLAIERLVRIVRESPSDRDARMAAVALLNLDPDNFQPVSAATAAPASEPPAAPKSPTDPPLAPTELAALRRLLPHMRPERFLRKPPTYWRSLLVKHAPQRQAG